MLETFWDIWKCSSYLLFFVSWLKLKKWSNDDTNRKVILQHFLFHAPLLKLFSPSLKNIFAAAAKEVQADKPWTNFKKRCFVIHTLTATDFVKYKTVF